MPDVNGIPAISAQAISKHFGGTVALHDATLICQSGSIRQYHALEYHQIRSVKYRIHNLPRPLEHHL